MINKSQAKIRLNKLREMINDYRYHYHVLDESIMSEAAADSLKHELSQLEEEYPDLITNDSPSQRVAGGVASGFKSVAHSERMLSLNDIFSRDELQAWWVKISKLLSASEKKDTQYFSDIKLDGLACALIYQDGSLDSAITRGDGYNGEDVSSNVRTITSVPLKLRNPSDQKLKGFLRGRTEIRGEIVMYKKDFATLNVEREKLGLPLYANARNTAAGTIRQLDSSLVSQRKLYFHAYDLRAELPVTTNLAVYETMSQLGFITGLRYQAAFVEHNIKSLIDRISSWEEKRHKLPFNSDGLVIKINDRKIYNKLGVVGKAPRGAVAFKYPAEQSTTKLLDIFVSIGRTGAATPVAILNPVLIAGSTVQMATLHNEGEIKRKGLKIGDTVIIQKAGDIIPEIVEPLLKLRNGSEVDFIMPINCPECQTKLVRALKEAVWRCPNELCLSRVQRLIEHFASKGALDIEGLGEKNVAALLLRGVIADVADIYAIEKDQLLKMDRFAELSAQNLITSINEKRNPNLDRFLFGLGIRHVGIQSAIDLAGCFGTIENLAAATMNDLYSVEGVGEVVAESLATWFASAENISLLKKFSEYGVKIQKYKSLKGPLSGKSFVITGTLQALSREAAAEIIRSLGGTFQSSVGKGTSYLVMGENAGESKAIKARSLGTKVIDEKTFLKLL